jgi:protein SERAC1
MWLRKHEHYRTWLERSQVSEYRGLLRIKGNPGSGKSTLMKAAFQTISTDLGAQGVQTASFYFNAKGTDLEKTPLGFFRSVLYQLLQSAIPSQLQAFAESQREKFPILQNEEEIAWNEHELRSLLECFVSDTRIPRIIIVVDALDECVEGERDLTYFFRDITTRAYKSETALDICFSSRFYPIVSLESCPEIVMENSNQADIKSYVRQKLQTANGILEQEEIILVRQIVEKAEGNFLWVVLIVSMLLKDRDEGKGFMVLRRRLNQNQVPVTLNSLYRELLAGFRGRSTAERQLVVRLFQWVTLSMQPLRMREWHQIFAMLGGKSPRSLNEWRNSVDYVGDQSQLEKRIRTLSCGLIEIRGGPDIGRTEDGDSNFAYAGSLDPDHGETRFVQLIHESVRSFFLYEGGFSVLDPLLETPIGSGHISIMNMCLDYQGISELDALVEARLKLKFNTAPLGTSDAGNENEEDGFSIVKAKHPLKRRSSDCSIGSFASAGSSDYRSLRASPRSSLRDSDSADLDSDHLFPFYCYSSKDTPSSSSDTQDMLDIEEFQLDEERQDVQDLQETTHVQISNEGEEIMSAEGSRKESYGTIHLEINPPSCILLTGCN